MKDQAIEHRLAAILVADVAGYTRLMEADEAGVYARWRETRDEIIEPTITARRGRVVKFTGDGVLAEFPTAQSAVACALEIQELLRRPNALQMRIGLHLGDIYLENGDVYGDGVNVASRLQELAEVGGICMSSAVHDLVRKSVQGAFEDGGERRLKHIAEPVRIWRVSPAPPPTAAVVKAAEAASQRPGIAVLPFTNMSGDVEQEYFADGLVEDLITELARTGALHVIARNSTFVFKGRPVAIADVARELRVRYVLEGSVRKAGQRIRVTAQLIDAAGGGHLWAERFDRALDDIFAVQDEITRSIIGALALSLAPESVHSIDRGTRSIEAYDLFLKGREFAWLMTRAANTQAKPLLEKAIAADPGFARAHAILGHVYLASWLNHWSDDPAADERRGFEFAQKADPTQSIRPARLLDRRQRTLMAEGIRVGLGDGRAGARDRPVFLHRILHARRGVARPWSRRRGAELVRHRSSERSARSDDHAPLPRPRPVHARSVRGGGDVA